MLERMKKLLELEEVDIPNDEVCTQYLELAIKAACRHSNVDELSEAYDNTVVELSIYLYTHKDSLDLKVKQEGERTATFNVENGIPDYIKMALPMPRVRVI